MQPTRDKSCTKILGQPTRDKSCIKILGQLLLGTSIVSSPAGFLAEILRHQIFEVSSDLLIRIIKPGLM